jgi:hypothetical protein
MRMTFTALPITSAGRRSPQGRWALEIFPNECFDCARWQLDRKDNLIIGRKP